MLSNWKKYRLNELFDFHSGMSYSRSVLGEEGAYYLHYGDIHKMNQSVFDTSVDTWLPKIDKDVNELKEHALLYSGDVVFADASEDYEGIAKSVVIKNDEGLPFLSGLHTIIGKDKTNILSNEYKKYFLLTQEVKRQYRFLATGTSVYGISKSNLPKVEVLVPPLNEQRKIADFLTSVDNAISKTEAIIEQTEKVRKGLMQQLLTKGIGHTKFKQTEIGEIPEEWQLRSVGEMAQIQGGYAFKSSEYKNEGIQLIRISNLFGNYLNLTKDPVFLPSSFAVDYERYVIKPNDLIICMTGTVGKEDYGHVVEIPDELQHRLLLNQRVGRFNLQQELDKDFFYYFLSSRLFLDVIYSYGSGSKQANLSGKQIESVLMPLPPIQEQKRIGSVIRSIALKLDNEKAKCYQLQRLKKGLMQVLLTGKIRVKVDDQEAVTT
jgi:type I restriction enzyme S subunit